MKKITFLNLLLLLVSASFFAQTTYYVKADGDNSDGLTETTAFSTVNNAVQAAADGDQIIIVGNLNQSGQVAIGKSLSFVGTSDATLTANATARMYNVSAPSLSISFENIVFQNANATVQGSVINLTANSDVTITNCTFKNNTSANNGTILAGGTGTLTVTNCLFDGNSANRGGAIAITTAGRTLIVSGSTFVNNTATGNDGGAMFIGGNNANSSITNTTIFNNSVVNATLNKSKGAGMRIEGVKPLTIQNCLIYGNTVVDGNGGSDPADIGVVPNTVLSFVHSITKNIEPSLDAAEGDVFNTSVIDAELTASNLRFDQAIGKVIYDTVDQGVDSPIDFGSDGNDAGAWDSGFTLSLDREDLLASKISIYHNKSINTLELYHTISEPISIEIYNILGAKILNLKDVAKSQSIRASSLKNGIYILVGKTRYKFFSKKFLIN